MPSLRAAETQADAVVQPVRLRLYFDANGEIARRKFGEPRQAGHQLRRQDAAAKRRHDMVRAAFEEAGGDAVAEPFQMKAGAAAAVAWRDMRWQDRKRRHPGAGEETVELGLFPGGDGLVLPMLEAAAATGRKGLTVRLAALWRGAENFGQRRLHPLAAEADRLRDDPLAGKGCRHEDGMFLGAVMMRVFGAADTVAARPDMGDRELDRRRVARQAGAAVPALVRFPV